MSSVALPVSVASSLAWFATTAKPFPTFAGPCGLNRRVEGEKVGLLGDARDDLHDLTDLVRALAELGHDRVRLPGGVNGLRSHTAGVGCVLRDLTIDADISSVLAETELT